MVKIPRLCYERFLLHPKDNRDSNLISINVLKYLTVIIDYCAVYVIVTTLDVTDYPHPVLLSMTENTLAHSWTNHTCKSLIIGKLLAFFSLFSSWTISWESTQSGWAQLATTLQTKSLASKRCMHLLLNNFPLTIPCTNRSILSWRAVVSFNRHQTCSPVSETYWCTISCQVSIM